MKSISKVKKEEIAIICLSPFQGGMEIDTLKLAKNFSSEYSVNVIAKKNYFIANNLKTNNHIHLHAIDFKMYFSFSIIFGVRKIVKERNIRNVLFLGASEMRSLFFSFLGLDINLIIRHGTTKSSSKKDIFHKLIYSKVSYHVAICNHLASNVKKIFPLGKNSKIETIYPSLNLSFKQKKRDVNTPIKVLHTGRVVDGKGHKDAIEACQVLYNNNIDFELKFVGQINEYCHEELKSTIETKPYKKNILFIGHSNSIEKFYDDSDIFLFPSYGEGLSNSFIEALASGLVCISYDNTSFPELKEMGLHFHLAPDRDIISLSKKLLDCATNLNQELEKSSKNHGLCTDIFSDEIEIKKYKNIFKNNNLT